MIGSAWTTAGGCHGRPVSVERGAFGQKQTSVSSHMVEDEGFEQSVSIESFRMA